MEIKKEVEAIMDLYNGLEYSETENTLVGRIYISENDSYELKIMLAHYPNVFPDVEEIGERIPKKADRHIYTDTGYCCFTTSAIAQILLKTKIKSLTDFVKHIIIPYLENNSYYEINKRYIKDEFAHGAPGVIEGYNDILGTTGDFKILKLLNDAIQGRYITQSDLCYCGSSKALKNCHNGKHYRNYNRFRMINRNILMGDAFDIMVYKRRE